MDNLRRGQINDFADHVRKALRLGTPTDVEHAVALLGGELENFDEKFGDTAEAYVRKRGDSFAIASRTEFNNRRRFSIAHEIGHLFLHLGYMVDTDRWNSAGDGYIDAVKFRVGYNEEEFEAHEFAGAFLMPAEEFREVSYRNFDGHQFSLSHIAAEFDVSVMAAKTRGQWLGIFNWG